MKAGLSVAFESARGTAGTAVFSNGHYGLVVKPRHKGRDPQSPAQQRMRLIMSKASRAFRELTDSQLEAWNAYAAGLTRVDAQTGHRYHPTAQTLFVGFATKFLQANPAGSIPLYPPSSAFAGDQVRIAVSVAPGEITFTADRPNAPGVTTELLLQPLASRVRKAYEKEFRTQAFRSFEDGELSATLAVEPGYYAAATRFVNTATGQTAPLQPFPGVLTVQWGAETGEAA